MEDRLADLNNMPVELMRDVSGEIAMQEENQKVYVHMSIVYMFSPRVNSSLSPLSLTGVLFKLCSLTGLADQPFSGCQHQSCFQRAG